jgi:hypothetical protein
VLLSEANRLISLAIVALLSMACVRPPSPAWQPLSLWVRPLCYVGLTPVDSPAAARFYRVFERLLAVAQPDIDPRLSVAAVIVQAAPGAILPPRPPDGWTCVQKGSDPSSSTVVMFAEVVLRAESDGDPDAALARVLAHELAHVAGHASEEAAEAIGAYYAERAGFDCRRWVVGFGPHWVPDGERRALIERACIRAKKGLRPLVGAPAKESGGR